MELQLKRIMQEQGRTQQWLGEQLGTTAQYAGQIVRGNAGATMAQYERIADALGVKLWQLFAPKDDYILSDDHARIVEDLTKKRALDNRPDLILVDRNTGKTSNYALINDAPSL